MSHVLPIAPPTAHRRGACPSLDAPIATGDGLLARIRVRGGRLAPRVLEGLANIAGTYGNGVVEITARGNLQVRGLAQPAVPHFARDVRQLLDIETGLVIETPPLAGDDPQEIADPRPLAEAIRTASAHLVDRLGPKVTVVVDGQGQIGLGGLKADLRLLAVAPDQWALQVGNSFLGTTRYPTDCVQVILTRLAALDPVAHATDLDNALLQAWLAGLVTPSAPIEWATTSTIGHFTLRSARATGIGLPFGAIAWQSLVAIAQDASHYGITELRLAPHHTLLAIGASDALVSDAPHIGYITDLADPRTHISACIGSDGCASGHIAARAVAARLARKLPVGARLHVSGCAKGCAHPRRADLTLVGQPDGYGLVIDGWAGDTPLTVLRADQLESAIASAGQGCR